jgi:reactive chlorine resistance protein C
VDILPFSTWRSRSYSFGSEDEVTSYEAHGNAPLIDNSPLMSWLNVVFGVQGASDVIGVIELSTAMMLILGAFNAAASALGAAMSSVTFVITLSFFLTHRE